MRVAYSNHDPISSVLIDVCTNQPRLDSRLIWLAGYTKPRPKWRGQMVVTPRLGYEASSHAQVWGRGSKPRQGLDTRFLGFRSSMSLYVREHQVLVAWTAGPPHLAEVTVKVILSLDMRISFDSKSFSLAPVKYDLDMTSDDVGQTGRSSFRSNVWQSDCTLTPCISDTTGPPSCITTRRARFWICVAVAILDLLKISYLKESFAGTLCVE